MRYRSALLATVVLLAGCGGSAAVAPTATVRAPARTPVVGNAATITSAEVRGVDATVQGFTSDLIHGQNDAARLYLAPGSQARHAGIALDAAAGIAGQHALSASFRIMQMTGRSAVVAVSYAVPHGAVHDTLQVVQVGKRWLIAVMSQHA